MKKALIIIGIIIGVIVLALLAYSLLQPVIYDKYYNNAQREFGAAGLSDGMVPQGMAYIDGVFLQCGYMSDGKSASRIYITSGESERYVELLDADGNPYTGHTGGITAGEKYVWLANDGDTEDDNCVWVLDRSVLLDEGTTKIKLEKRFFAESRGATCYAANGYLYVGEYYNGARYTTKESHRFTTADGEQNALICIYKIDESYPLGVASTVPLGAYSVCDQLQGIAVGEDEIILSCSGGLASSRLIKHKAPQGDADGSLEVNGTAVPVWFLDSTTLVDSVDMPPMSEGIVLKDGRVLVLYESACHKYIFGILTRGGDVYSYKFDK